ncbi:MAG: M20/M25/M40 family metallo-hydrolase [Acidobacteriota bacterium]
MNRKSFIVFTLGLLLLMAPAIAQQKRAAFDAPSAFGLVKALSTDAMQGRMSGEPGGQMAADYIAAKFKEWKLDPAGLAGGYFQDISFEYYEVARGASLDVIAGAAKRDFVYDEDWRATRYSGSGSFGAEIVFAGYGISAPAKDYDDYAGLDVKGKLVMFSTDAPRALADKLKDEAAFAARIKAAREHGALGAVTFRPATMMFGAAPQPAYYGGPGLKKEDYQADFVVLSLEAKVADFIFKHQKADPRYYYQQIETTSKPQSFATGVRAFVNLSVAYDPKRATPNVLAKIPGTDPKLKNEYVIVGGHYDHLGIDQAGDVFNGADDNASGTAVVMEVARTMKLNRVAPKRTIVFALWAAEEEGLLGSKYYTENPVYPLDKTVAYINLDMEGHGTGKVNFRGQYFAPEVWDVLKARLPKDMVDNVNTGRGGPGGSDHTYFLYQGVPAYFVATDGPHFKTNRVGDVIDLIKPEILKKAGDFVGAATEVLASDPKASILPGRRELYYWRYETIINHMLPPLGEFVGKRKDVADPDVDIQLAVVGGKDGLSGDALRLDVMKNLLAGLDDLKSAKGLVLQSAAPSPMMSMMRGGPSKTAIAVGLAGLAAVRDDLRWADVFAKQGMAFIALDGPDGLFGEKGLSEEGKKIVGALGRAGLFLMVKGLDAGQNQALLEAARTPVMIKTDAVPGSELAALVKKTRSVVGLVMGKDEDPAAYFKKLDEAKKALGTENLAIVAEKCLWSAAGKEQVIKLIGEMLRAKYDNDALAQLFSGSLQRAFAAAKSQP